MAEPVAQPFVASFSEPVPGPHEHSPDRSISYLRSTFPAAFAGQLRSAREMARAHEAVHREAPLPTSLRLVDALLGGGLERGVLTELVGGRSSGRFGMVLAALAASTALGEATALIDLGDGLDPQAAAAAGCTLERLLWVRPERLRDALAATEMALQSGFALVVLDLGCPPVPGGRASDATWLRLQRAAVGPGAALLVSSPYRVSGPAAGTVLRARARRIAWSGSGREPRLLAALAAQLEIEKCRQSSPHTLALREMAHRRATAREVQLAWRAAGSFAGEIGTDLATMAALAAMRAAAAPRRSTIVPRPQIQRPAVSILGPLPGLLPSPQSLQSLPSTPPPP